MDKSTTEILVLKRNADDNKCMKKMFNMSSSKGNTMSTINKC